MAGLPPSGDLFQGCGRKIVCTFVEMRILLLLLAVLIAGYSHAQSYSSGYSKDTVSAAELDGKSASQLIKEANSNAADNPLKSIKQASRALELSIAEKDKVNQYKSYNTLGSLYYNVGNYKAAVQYFQMASKGFAEIKDKKNKAFSDKYLALAESRLNEVVVKKGKSEKELYRKEKTSGAPSKIAIEKNSTIDIAAELGKIDHTDTVLSSSIIQNAGKRALVAPDAVLLSNSTSFTNTLNSAGLFTDNIKLQQKFLVEGQKRGSSEIVSKSAYNLGTTLIEAKQPTDAIPYLIQSIAVADKGNDIAQKQKSVKELARAYEKAGRYDKALDVIKDHIKYLDSVQSLHDRDLEANAELNAEFMKQEERIQRLIAVQEQREEDLRRQRTIMWGLAIALALFGALTWMLVRNIRQKQKANMKIRLQSLRTQMNPHFIFNSLNSVNNFISKNDEISANRYLSDFSNLMRSVLKNSDEDFVSLETEINTLRIYLDLEHFRFGEKFNFSLEIADDIEPEHVKVPPMLIQPYIENAVWHGLRYKEDKGLLEVKFYTEDQKLYCTVRDNGIGREESARLKTNHQKTYQSTGIKNTRERIDILNKLHGTSLQISIFDLNENGKATGTLVRISLPYIMQFEEV